MSGKYFLATMLVVVLFVGGFIVVSNQPIKAHTLVVTANYVQLAPKGIDDPIWSKANAVQLLVEGREKSVGGNSTVTARSIYSDESLYFLFKWKDPTRSVIKQSWEFDGEKWNNLKQLSHVILLYPHNNGRLWMVQSR